MIYWRPQWDRKMNSDSNNVNTKRYNTKKQLQGKPVMIPIQLFPTTFSPDQKECPSLQKRVLLPTQSPVMI